VNGRRKFGLRHLAVSLVISVCLSWIIIRFSGRTDQIPVVVIYTSQDQVYAEPIFREFRRQSHLKVLPVYDSEAVKTVGLVNRLVAEKDHPQCDVFWNNEELRTRQLEKAGVLRETNSWAAFGFRTRRLVINTNQLTNPNCPRTFIALTNQACRSKIALAYPLFGTTATHFLVLRQTWGEVKWETWCRALIANKPLLVDGNSAVVKMVAAGEAWIGMTDSDDIMAGKREGLPVESLSLYDENFFIRNTVAVIRNAPHPEQAEKLFAFLKSDEVHQQLIQAGAIEGFDAGEISITPPTIDWDKLLREQDAGVAKLKEIFLR
jgi:iron(III) transport system substrate-binding protein